MTDEPTKEEIHYARLTLSDRFSSIEDIQWAQAVLARAVDATLVPEPDSAPLAGPETKR